MPAMAMGIKLDLAPDVSIFWLLGKEAEFQDETSHFHLLLDEPRRTATVY